MKKLVVRALFIGGMAMFVSGGLTSCAPKPGCAAVAGTGTTKPKLRKKPQDGLTSKKMQKAMAKSKGKKVSPIAKKKLSMEQ